MVPDGLGRQWYSLFPPDWEAVPEAVSGLQRRLVDLESVQIPMEKTVLIGFSQGGAIALASGCSLPFAGLIGCSAYPHPSWVFDKDRPPVLLTHGSGDEVVPFAASENLLESLRGSQKDVDLARFDGGHTIPRELIPRMRLVISTWFAEDGL